MKKKLLALLLVLAMLLPGCAKNYADPQVDVTTMVEEKRNLFQTLGPVSFDDMEYVRPDPEGLTAAIEEATAQFPGQDFDAAYEVFDSIYNQVLEYATMDTIAMIRYYQNMSDAALQEESEFCDTGYTDVSTAFDTYCDLIADSDLKATFESEEYYGEGFFDGYGSDSLDLSLAKEQFARQTDLEAQYNRIMASASTDAYGDYTGQDLEDIAEIYVELIQVRNEIASIYGYDSFESYACENIYDRDYDSAETQVFLQGIKDHIVPVFDRLCGSYYAYSINFTACDEEDMLNYASSAAKAMGGEVLEGWKFMTENGLCDLSYSDNKYNGSFETFLYTYEVPFVFVNPTGSLGDELTTVHEFGHFLQDYIWTGEHGANIDVAEIFSQSLEYLSLDYADITSRQRENMLAYQLMSCVNVYIQQAAFYEFEQQAYRLPESERNVQGLNTLFARIMAEYHITDYYSISDAFWAQIPHLFSSPYYVISYCTSIDAAVQVFEYQVNTGEGLELYLDLMYESDQPLLVMLETCGLESPFTADRMEHAAAFLEEQIFDN